MQARLPVGGAVTLDTLVVSGYRFLLNLLVPLGRLNLNTGANGGTKS